MLVSEVTKVPCSRYEGGENEERVSIVFAYALGIIGTDDVLNTIRDYVARVHDHKGELFVVTRKELPASWRMAFGRAWEDLGYEVRENVSFPAADSKEWSNVWSSRRFDSDWQP